MLQLMVHRITTWP